MKQNILQTIGNTPLVKLNKIIDKDSADIYAKIESFNPGSSVKDRIALNMIEDAEKKEILKQGSVIIEPISGNTGIGLAIVAAVKGYKTIFTMPENFSVERRKLLQFLGAEIILTDKKKGMNGTIEKAEELVKEKGYFMPQQFENPANPQMHKKTTSKEIIKQLDNIELDYFVAGVGTGGTISGTGEIFKNHYNDIKIIAVEPKDSPVLSGGKPGPHNVQGIGAGFIPKIYNPDVVDEIMQVSNKDSYETSRKLAQEEGILCGISSGGNVWAALQVAKKAGKGKTIVVIICDTGERYLSTELFGG